MRRGFLSERKYSFTRLVGIISDLSTCESKVAVYARCSVKTYIPWHPFLLPFARSLSGRCEIVESTFLEMPEYAESREFHDPAVSKRNEIRYTLYKYTTT